MIPNSSPSRISLVFIFLLTAALPGLHAQGTPQTPSIQFELLDMELIPIGLAENGKYLVPQGKPFYVRLTADAGSGSVQFIHFRLFLPNMNHPSGWTPPGMPAAHAPDSQKSGPGPHIFGPFYTTAQNANEISAMMGDWHYDIWVHTSAFQDGRVGMGYNYLHSSDYPRAHEFAWRGGDATNRNSPRISIFNNHEPNAFIASDKVVMYADETAQLEMLANDPDGNLRSLLFWERHNGGPWMPYNQGGTRIPFPAESNWQMSLPNSANGLALIVANNPRNRDSLHHEREWIPQSGPGTYTLQVMALDSGGLLSGTRQVTIEVFLVPTVTELSYSVPGSIQNIFPDDTLLLTAVVRSDRPGAPSLPLVDPSITYQLVQIKNLNGTIPTGTVTPTLSVGGSIPNDTGEAFGLITLQAEYAGDGGMIYGPSTSAPVTIQVRNPSYPRQLGVRAFPPANASNWFEASAQNDHIYSILRPR